MAACYEPLVLPAQLHDMRQDYQTRITKFDGTIYINAQQHIDMMNEFFYLHEVDENDAKLRLFA